MSIIPAPDETPDPGADLPAMVITTPTLRGLLAHAQAFGVDDIEPYSAEDVDTNDLLGKIAAEYRTAAAPDPGEAVERLAATLDLLDRLDGSGESYDTDLIRAHLTGQATPPAGVRRFLDLSTRHLPPRIDANLNGYDGVTAISTGDGWLMSVPDDPDGHAADYGDPAFYDGVPEEVLIVQRHARDLGCDRVLFDRDAARVAGLPTYKWH